MTLKVEYKRNHPEELKSKKICCLNGLKRYRGKKCIKGSKGLDEETLNQIIHQNLQATIKQLLDETKIKNLILRQNDEKIANSRNSSKEILNKDLERIEDEIKTLYLDYKQDLLDEDDYKKYYREKSNEKNRVKQELEILTKEEKNRPVITEDKVNELVTNILNMKELDKDILSEIIYDIQIDKDNQIYINYRYDIFSMVA